MLIRREPGFFNLLFNINKCYNVYFIFLIMYLILYMLMSEPLSCRLIRQILAFARKNFHPMAKDVLYLKGNKER